MKQIYLILYYAIAKYLPVSYSKFGGISMKIRYLCCKHIFKKIGRNVNIERGVNFGNGFNIEIGDNSGIGINCSVPNNIKIGNDVMMGPDCHLFENRTHVISDINKPMREQGHYIKEGRIEINDDVWIGAKVLIMPCKHIGSHSVFAAGSVVCNNIPDYVIAGGNPCKIIKNR